ncbi:MULTISPECIES: hypothetical protein [Desulfosediminicola]|uniref:hypothetical protein n=1 Tax=Desulfosediminicola TaxID=2886823 RepID=UPI0010AB628C|nr:hypothetical protein [Desulfosediminicola ganghwensis]
MHINLIRLYWLRLAAAALALLLAILYLAEFEKVSLAGFALIALIGGYIGIRINNSTMPARCDLCGSVGTMGAEYGAGYANARLILNCSRCGRVVNGKPGSVKPQKE